MSPKILVLDIETSLMELYGFGIRDQYISADQIKKDWTILSFASKWVGKSKVHQCDTRKSGEKQLLIKIKSLLDEADIVVGHNSKKFDVKRINAKFSEYGILPPSSFQQVDTYNLSKKYFNFSSHTLEYLLQKLNSPIRKLKHGKYPGKSLWIECDKGNKDAFKEMAKYNIHDVLGTEWLYQKLAPWGIGINFNVYYGDKDARCSCGSQEFNKNGYTYGASGKYQRFYCKQCGAELKARQNLAKKGLTPVKR
jgi:DNA polymerase elongation subunit (family B)